jgi:hypothetical protein
MDARVRPAHDASVCNPADNMRSACAEKPSRRTSNHATEQSGIGGCAAAKSGHNSRFRFAGIE